MKYKVGQFVAREDSVLLRVVVAMQGEVEIYGLFNIKDPGNLNWMSEPEIKHEGYKLAKPDHGIKEAHPGDLVRIGTDQVVKVLARSGDALLLSQGKSGQMGQVVPGMPKAISDLLGLKPVVDPKLEEHLHIHNTTKYVHNACDDWYDIEYMVLMNWKLVRE